MAVLLPINSSFFSSIWFAFTIFFHAGLIRFWWFTRKHASLHRLFTICNGNFFFHAMACAFCLESRAWRNLIKSFVFCLFTQKHYSIELRNGFFLWMLVVLLLENLIKSIVFMWFCNKPIMNERYRWAHFILNALSLRNAIESLLVCSTLWIWRQGAEPSASRFEISVSIIRIWTIQMQQQQQQRSNWLLSQWSMLMTPWHISAPNSKLHFIVNANINEFVANLWLLSPKTNYICEAKFCGLRVMLPFDCFLLLFNVPAGSWNIDFHYHEKCTMATSAVLVYSNTCMHIDSNNCRIWYEQTNLIEAYANWKLHQ